MEKFRLICYTPEQGHTVCPEGFTLAQRVRMERKIHQLDDNPTRLKLYFIPQYHEEQLDRRHNQ